MLNIELPSDLTGYRHTCNGWFRREGMICGGRHGKSAEGGLISVSTEPIRGDGHGSVGVVSAEASAPVAAISGKGRWG